MKRFLVLGIAALFAVSCSKSNTAVVNATINGASQKDIIVSQLVVNNIKIVDTVKTGSNGTMKARIAVKESPNFYYLSYNGKKLASLILKAGDKVTLSVDTLGNSLNIEGSDESVLLTEYEKSFAATQAEFDKLSEQMISAVEANNQKHAKQLSADLGKLFIKYRQSVIRNIMTNPYAFANIQALHQSLSQAYPIFGSENDHLLVRRVYDSLQTVYPNSVYVKSLKEQLDASFVAQELSRKIAQAYETAFPNISLPDINAKNIELASLEGKPFLLVFWTISDAKQKMFNNDLLEIYKKYKSQGFEIYQVCVDTDKTAWATIVKEQNMPWINVCDGKGAASPAVLAYNVATIPSFYVFDKKGDIVASKELTSKAAIEKAVIKVVK